jgi:hypothetical protein
MAREGDVKGAQVYNQIGVDVFQVPAPCVPSSFSRTLPYAPRLHHPIRNASSGPGDHLRPMPAARAVRCGGPQAMADPATRLGRQAPRSACEPHGGLPEEGLGEGP